jgi:hypothetical protein
MAYADISQAVNTLVFFSGEGCKTHKNRQTPFYSEDHASKTRADFPAFFPVL